nr:transposase domain-containing protein [uncultured Rhodopila sp.]
MSLHWLSAAELLAHALDGLPATLPALRAFAERQGWEQRKRAGKGGGTEYHVAGLSADQRAALALKLAPAAPTRPDGARSERWEWFERQAETLQARARDRLAALEAVGKLVAGGTSKLAAMALVAGQTGANKSSLYNWEARTHGIPRADWLPHLADGWGATAERTDCPAEAWDMLRADYLRLERPSFAACHRRLQMAAKAKGWTLPSARTLERRLLEIPEATRVFARQGAEALKRLYPAQERSRAHFHALEAINVDGHKWDVFVKWPDGEILRPLMVAFQDLYSGKLLSWRIDKSENKEATRLAFGDLVEQFGIPEHCWLDNGRAFASKWITGGTPTRYRFKVRDEDPVGLLPLLGVQAHWTNPYSGQSKPIERAFRDFAGDTAKHPAFAGAYVGNSPMAKPENYGSSAVPLETFLRVLGEAVAEHNARPGRDTAVCNGRSFDQAFTESYATAPIRKAAPAQRRLWLLAAEGVLCARTDGSIRLEGNRFWAEFLAGQRGARVSVRFDPQSLHDDLHVYGLDGRYLGAAPCVEAVGFDDAEAARAHNRARNAWLRGVRMQAEAERKMTIGQVAELLPGAPAAAPAPNTKIVRPVFGNTALKPREELAEQSEAEILLMRGLRIVRAQADSQ